MKHENFEHLGGRARIASLLLIIGIIVDAASFLLQVVSAGMGIDTNAEEPTTQALVMIITMAGLGLGQIILLIATAVFFLRWMHQAYRNLHNQGYEGLRTSSGTAVTYWFIPILNLFRPFQVMKEIWKGSDPSSTRDNWKSVKAPAMFNAWWAFWLLQSFVDQAAFKLAMKGGPETAGVADTLSAGSDILSVAAGLCLLQIVKIITNNQDMKFAAQSASPSAESPANSQT